MSRIATAWRQWTPQSALVVIIGALVIVFAAGLGAGNLAAGLGAPHASAPAATATAQAAAWHVLLRAAGAGDATMVTTASFTVTAGVWRVVAPETCAVNGLGGDTQSLLVTMVNATTGASVAFLGVEGTCGGAGQDGLAVASETALGTFRLRVEAAQAWSLSVQQMEAA